MERKTGTAARQVSENFEDGNGSRDSLKDKFGQKIGETKERFTGNLSNAASRFHEKSDSAQEFLDAGADNLSEYAHQAIGKANQLGHRAADALNTSSEYINNFDFEKTKQQVVETIKQKPQIGFAAAGLFGLLLGWIIGKRKSK